MNFLNKLKDNPTLLKMILLTTVIFIGYIIIDTFVLSKSKKSPSFSELSTKQKNITDLRGVIGTDNNLTKVEENSAKTKDLQKEAQLKGDITKATFLNPTERDVESVTFNEKQKEEKEKLKKEILKDNIELNITKPKEELKVKPIDIAINKKPNSVKKEDVISDVTYSNKNYKTTTQQQTQQNNVNNDKKKALLSLFKNDSERQVALTPYIPSVKVVEDNKTDDNKSDLKELYILPGSSFYGTLSNPLYSLHPNMKAIIHIEHKDFIGCNFIGDTQIFQTNAALMINLKSYACKDGKNGSVNGIAVNLDNFKPIFADEVNRHLLPKALILTVDALLGGINAAFEARNQQTTETDLTTMTSTKTWTNKATNPADYFKPNQELSNEILKELLSNYKTEISVNPQAMVVIFY